VQSWSQNTFGNGFPREEELTDSELIPLIGELRDQLKRLNEILESFDDLRIRLNDGDLDRIIAAIRGYKDPKEKRNW